MSAVIYISTISLLIELFQKLSIDPEILHSARHKSETSKGRHDQCCKIAHEARIGDDFIESPSLFNPLVHKGIEVRLLGRSLEFCGLPQRVLDYRYGYLVTSKEEAIKVLDRVLVCIVNGATYGIIFQCLSVTVVALIVNPVLSIVASRRLNCTILMKSVRIECLRDHHCLHVEFGDGLFNNLVTLAGFA